MDACWICGSASSRRYRESSLPSVPDASYVRATDREFGRTAELFRCDECGFIGAALEEAQRLAHLYEQVVDLEYLESSGARRLSFERLVRQIARLRPEAMQLIDLGASIGMLCEAAGARGIHAIGVEPGEWAVRQARARGIEMIRGYFPDALPEDVRADVITAVDVIEHVPHPVRFLAAAKAHLRPKGILVVVTPDISAPVARLLGSRWWGFRPAHIGYFTPTTMRLALSKAGLDLLESSTFARSFPLGYLVVRFGEYFRLGPAARRLVALRRLRWLFQQPVRLDPRDTRTYVAGLPD